MINAALRNRAELGHATWLTARAALTGYAMSLVAGVLLVVTYVALHYLFVSQTAHMLALLGVFLGVGVKVGVGGCCESQPTEPESITVPPVVMNWYAAPVLDNVSFSAPSMFDCFAAMRVSPPIPSRL